MAMLPAKNISRKKLSMGSNAVGFPHEKAMSGPWIGGGRINIGMEGKGGWRQKKDKNRNTC